MLFSKSENRKGSDIMSTEAQIKASQKYNQNNTKIINLRLNNKTDADVIEWLEKQDNKAGYIKRLIREDMAK